MYEKGSEYNYVGEWTKNQFFLNNISNTKSHIFNTHFFIYLVLERNILALNQFPIPRVSYRYEKRLNKHKIEILWVEFLIPCMMR